MLYINNRSIEPDTHRRIVLIELRVIEACRDNIFHRVSGSHSRDHGTHQQARDGGIAVREVMDIRLDKVRLNQTGRIPSRQPGIGQRNIGVSGFDAQPDVCCEILKDCKYVRLRYV